MALISCVWWKSVGKTLSQIIITETALQGVLLLTPRRFADERGWFGETFRAEILQSLGVSHSFVQDNEVFTADSGVMRGLHFQAPPKAQTKLIRVSQGSIFDVVVDIRSGSATFGCHIGVELSAETGRQLYVPAGFAHGYVTLSTRTAVAYKVDQYYAPETEGGLAWDDPALEIAWPHIAPAIASDRDRSWPTLSELKSPF